MTDEHAAPASTARPWRWATRLRPASIAAFVALPIGALGTRFGLWGYSTGFLILGLGTIVALILGLLGAVAAIRHRRFPPQARPPGPEASIGIAVIILLIFMPAVRAGLTTPPIHQVSTDLLDPPEFSAIRDRRGPDSNPVVLTTEMIDLQRAHYPWVRSQTIPQLADLVYEAALTVLEERMVLEIVDSDRIDRIIEATDTSFWFGFKDDVVVRVLFDPRGAKVDIRSISRVGRSDLGVNADRVAEFFTYLAEETGYDPGPFQVP